MSNDRLKFRQPYFLQDDTFSHWHYWGWMSEGEFVSPLSMGHNVKGEMGQQWTGLYDSDGREIYEDDKVSKGCEPFAPEHSGVVKFHHGCWMVMYDDEAHYFNLHFYVEQCKVTGNIYDA